MASLNQRVSYLEAELVVIKKEMEEQKTSINEILAYASGAKKVGTFISRHAPRVFTALSSALIGAGIVTGWPADFLTKFN